MRSGVIINSLFTCGNPQRVGSGQFFGSTDLAKVLTGLLADLVGVTGSAVG